MKITITKEQMSYLDSLSKGKDKRKFLLDAVLQNLEYEIEKEDIIQKSQNQEIPMLFCVKVDEENIKTLRKIQSDFHDIYSEIDIDDYLHMNSLKTFCYGRNVATDFKKQIIEVDTNTFLKYIGKEDLIEKEDFTKGILFEVTTETFKTTDDNEHQLMNTPLLSLNEILSLWGHEDDTEYYIKSPMFIRFKELAKLKL